MTNRYTYKVIKCNGIPLHFVYSKCNLYCGLKVFSTKEQADEEMYINYTFGLEYDERLKIPALFIEYYQNNEHLFSKIEDRQVYCGY